MTGQALINAALKWLNELNGDQLPNATESANALVRLNALIGSWNIQDSMATSAVQATVALNSGTQGYALATRVAKVVSASVVMDAGPTMPVRVVNAEEWNSLPDRDISSNLIKALFYDRGYPTGTIYLSPVPLANLELTYTAWAAQPTFATLATDNTLLPGYEQALTAALAIQIAPNYAVSTSEELRDSYKEAMAEIRRLNQQLWGMVPAEVAA